MCFMKPKPSKSKLPIWFQADQTFSAIGSWFFGSRNGLHIGPYGDRNIAAQKGQRAAAHLRALKSDKDRLQYVRRVLRGEWKSIEKQTKRLSSDADVSPPLQPVRKGEAVKTWFRASRFQESEGVWFFDTRENIEVGPFETRAVAEHHERRLVTVLENVTTVEAAHAAIYEYKHHPATNPMLTRVG